MHTNPATIPADQTPSALWIYDTLMQEIEPDLMSGNIMHLDQKYAGEDPEDRTARFERYTLAFMTLQECLLDLEYDLRAQDAALHTVRLEQEQQAATVQENEVLQEIENALDSSSHSSDVPS